MCGGGGVTELVGLHLAVKAVQCQPLEGLGLAMLGELGLGQNVLAGLEPILVLLLLVVFLQSRSGKQKKGREKKGGGRG